MSTALQKENECSFTELSTFIKNSFPKAKHDIDLVFPEGMACDNYNKAFGLEDCDFLINNYSELFAKSRKGKIENFKRLFEHRCSGGVSQCTIQPDGLVKICTAACSQEMYFNRNVFDVGLIDLWNNYDENIAKIRLEKYHHNSLCIKCKYLLDCDLNDCRVFGFAYTGNPKNHNIIECEIYKRLQKREVK